MRRFPLQLLLVGLLVLPPQVSGAAEPERILSSTFDVRVEGIEPPVVEVTFALALSEISDYPVRITAIGANAEEELYFGTLKEGFYRLRAPLTRITSGPLKVVLKTKVTNRIPPAKLRDREDDDEEDEEGLSIVRSRPTGESYIRYLKWEGSIDR